MTELKVWKVIQGVDCVLGYHEEHALHSNYGIKVFPSHVLGLEIINQIVLYCLVASDSFHPRHKFLDRVHTHGVIRVYTLLLTQFEVAEYPSLRL